MSASIAVSSVTNLASLTAGVRLPTSGPAAPACDVEKNTGSMKSKSRSSRMRCTSTDPTIPRQPMMPTFMCRPLLVNRPQFYPPSFPVSPEGTQAVRFRTIHAPMFAILAVVTVLLVPAEATRAARLQSGRDPCTSPTCATSDVQSIYLRGWEAAVEAARVGGPPEALAPVRAAVADLERL